MRMGCVEVWDGTRWCKAVVIKSLMKKAIKNPIPVKAIQMNKKFRVYTLEGIMNGEAGDYLIQGVEGELYPCKASIFYKTYDFVREEKEREN